MLTNTSLSAVRELIFLAQAEPGVVLSLKTIAETLGESPTYLAKISRLLARAGIVRAVKGVNGGVQLGRPAAQISLLSIVEACQGAIVGSYCQAECPPEATCAFHQAALALEHAIVDTLRCWNLAQLSEAPRPTGPLPGGFSCVLERSGRSVR